LILGLIVLGLNGFSGSTFLTTFGGGYFMIFFFGAFFGIGSRIGTFLLSS